MLNPHFKSKMSDAARLEVLSTIHPILVCEVQFCFVSFFDLIFSSSLLPPLCLEFV